MATKKTYIKVILPLKLEWDPYYSIEEEDARDIHVGKRVRVVFVNKNYVGVVSEINVTPNINSGKILPIIAIESGLEEITEEELDLWKQIAEYYMCSIGEVYKAAYPELRILSEETQQRRQKQKEKKLTQLKERLRKAEESLANAKSEAGENMHKKRIEKILLEIAMVENKGINNVEIEKYRGEKEEEKGSAITRESKIVLSEAQNQAYENIKKSFEEDKPCLLHGVTSSGKTEIYLKLAHDTLKSGKNVLYLVPEITMSRQLELRVKEHFGNLVLYFHSKENNLSRRETADRIREGKPYILLGTRSSIFLPHNNLGLIIIDEEHDPSYKQEDPAPRYNGRDTALMLANIHSAKTVLGSATPSLESLFNCQIGKFNYCALSEKYYKSTPSEIEIIDTKAERKKRGMIGNFSRILIGEIEKRLKVKEQIILIRPRKSYSTLLQCESCGDILKCPHCHVSLSHNKTSNALVCHYCGYRTRFDDNCKCGGKYKELGAGTQKIEEEARSLFPNANIARLDSDSTQNKTYEKNTLEGFAQGKIDILIGTQILAKGFDFNNLTLVALINGDSVLGLQDFRADEKTLQLIEQLRGRSGRREIQGKIVIQTAQPEHPVYLHLSQNSVNELYQNLLEERRNFAFPPFSRIIKLELKDREEWRAQKMSDKLANQLQGKFDIIGPYAPVIDKIANQYIRHIRISLKKNRAAASKKKELRDIIEKFSKDEKYGSKLIINVDPL